MLKDDAPDFVSVTYGAGGTTRSRTVEITKWIKQDLGIEAMAHLSCVGEPAERLRGDPRRDRRPPASRTCSRCAATRPAARPSGARTRAASHYSVELIRLIRERFDFCVGAACFPEIHPDAPDRDSDLRYARAKAGRRRRRS